MIDFAIGAKPKLLSAILLALSLTSCGGGDRADSSGTGEGEVSCDGNCQAEQLNSLSVADVETVIAQAVNEAKARNAKATIAVVDRVGNVLGVYRMTDADKQLKISTTADAEAAVDGGLEQLILPDGADALAAIAKAVTGAYLATEGNGFSTRTAGQIIQDHFNPGERNQPGGPLFGVQFSQLACSDFSLRDLGTGATGPGPHRSPLGLSADPGGFPLYKDGIAVGGVGVISDGFYSLDKNLLDFDTDQDELIALAASFGYQPPLNRRADQITVDGKVLRFSDVDNNQLASSPEGVNNYAALTATDGSLLAVTGYITAAAIRAGTIFGQAESGIRADVGLYSGQDAFVFVDGANSNRYPPIAGSAVAEAGTAVLSVNEVQTLMTEALAVANRARAQIRQPLSTQARVTVSVVDSEGNVLAMAQTRDAPVFGIEVSLQKARTAAFFSSPDAADFLGDAGLAKTQYFNSDLTANRQINIGDYLTDLRTFTANNNALADGTAFSDRAGGNLSRPFYPDGIEANPHGPLSKPSGEWSAFSTGLQLDLVMNGIVQHLFHVLAGTSEVGQTCVGLDISDLNNVVETASSDRLANGIQIFPGSVPIYRGDVLVGGIGVSGDGVDQDDMIAFLGLHNASQLLNGSIDNAPSDIRADNLKPKGERLRFIQCPQAPFLNSDSQNVCQGK
ncbi:MAG: heme-binding protein [Thalassolituus sp.]|jgi:uncharacterized protein GlcG (DUF336 family)